MERSASVCRIQPPCQRPPSQSLFCNPLISSPCACCRSFTTTTGLRMRRRAMLGAAASARGRADSAASTPSPPRSRAGPALERASVANVVRDDATGEGMTDLQLRDEVMTMFLAGHETTANALAWTLLLLGRHPEALAKVHAELDEVLEGRTPGLDDLSSLTYLGQVLDEGMRLYPPAWLVARARARFASGPRDDAHRPPAIACIGALLPCVAAPAARSLFKTSARLWCRKPSVV